MLPSRFVGRCWLEYLIYGIQIYFYSPLPLYHIFFCYLKRERERVFDGVSFSFAWWLLLLSPSPFYFVRDRVYKSVEQSRLLYLSLVLLRLLPPASVILFNTCRYCCCCGAFPIMESEFFFFALLKLASIITIVDVISAMFFFWFCLLFLLPNTIHKIEIQRCEGCLSLSFLRLRILTTDTTILNMSWHCP